MGSNADLLTHPGLIVAVSSPSSFYKFYDGLFFLMELRLCFIWDSIYYIFRIFVDEIRTFKEEDLMAKIVKKMVELN